jgi:hypothetical protein
MLILPIEKEIEGDHKIFKGFNFRQVIALLVILVCSFVFWRMTDDVFATILLDAIPCSLAIVFGWYNKYGLRAEDALIKQVTDKKYKNTQRRYRTKNQYFGMYSSVYQEEKNKKAADAKAKEQAAKKQVKGKAPKVPNKKEN